MEITEIKSAKKKHYGIGHIARLKERFTDGKVTEEELIELLLSFVIKGKDVKPQAKEIFRRSNRRLGNVFDTVLKGGIDGIGGESQLFFSVVREFFNGVRESRFMEKKYTLSNQRAVVDYFINLCADRGRESVYVLYLDAKNRIMSGKKASDGTITQSLMYPRFIIEEAMKCRAASIIVVHNHPSGDPRPSESDRKITDKLNTACRAMDIHLLDHIIVGNEGKGYFSFYEEGILSTRY